MSMHKAGGIKDSPVKTGIAAEKLSELCFGTMNFGQDAEEASAHKLLSVALSHGVNFWDTAELYPVPPSPETYGESERIIGRWFERNGRRAEVFLASKIVGPIEEGEGEHIREGQTRLNFRYLERAVEASLKRLRTDYLDLYQLHWPERTTNYFKRLNFKYVDDAGAIPIEETAAALDQLVRAGKIRYYGLSNETPWGVMRYLAQSERARIARPLTIQNPYNLLNRTYEIGLAEVSCRENVGLLAYSPLAFGALSGKYLRNPHDPGKRRVLNNYFNRYSGRRADAAIAEYVSLARNVGIEPAHMALAFIRQQPFVRSTIIGASSIAQLESNIASRNVVLSAEVLRAIDDIHLRVQNVCP